MLQKPKDKKGGEISNQSFLENRLPLTEGFAQASSQDLSLRA